MSEYNKSEHHNLYKVLKIKSLDEMLSFFNKLILDYPFEDQEKIKEGLKIAYEAHDGQLRASKIPYIIHPIAVACLLMSMSLDPATVISGLLHDTLEDTTLKPEEIEVKFGKDVLNLVDGVTKIQVVDEKNRTFKESRTIRKMLLAMCDDIRVIFIKLADKLHNMSTLGALSPEKIEKNAQECLDIYAPLAEKLGIISIHNLLEDLAFKSLYPKEYYEIKELVDSNKKDRENYLEKIKKRVNEEAHTIGLNLDIKVRSKHFYSIYQKLRMRSKELTEIFDMLGLRIYCQSKGDCYAVLGLIHSLYKPVEGRFKDYIAIPKTNGYQSIHTTVFMPDKRFVEFQIRTYEMDEIAESGVAAHCLYKENRGFNNHQEIALVNRLRQWKESLPEEGSEFLTSIKNDILGNSIYIFTPNGAVRELPEGSNAIDFAFAIHTDIGNHCYQAKVDGKIHPITKPLKTSSVVEIITNPKSHPIPNWLTTVRTKNARVRIRNWIKKNSPFILQEDILIKKPKKGIFSRKDEKEEVVKKSTFKKILHFFKRKEKNKIITKDPKEEIVSDEIDLQNILIGMASCCNPKKGDDIVGYISRGKGIIVHRFNCNNLKNLPELKEREVEVNWVGHQGNSLYRFDITFTHKENVFGIIEKIIKDNHAQLVSGRIDNEGNGEGIGVFHIESSNTTKERILSIMKDLSWITTVTTRGQVWNDFI